MHKARMTRALERELVASLRDDDGWIGRGDELRNYRLGIRIGGLFAPDMIDICLPGGGRIADLPVVGLALSWRWRVWRAAIRLLPAQSPPADSLALIRDRRRTGGSLVVPT